VKRAPACWWACLLLMLSSGCATGGRVIICGLETPSVDGHALSTKTVWAVISDPAKVQRTIAELRKLKRPDDTAEFTGSSPMIMNLFIADQRSLQVERIYWVQQDRVSGVRGRSMYGSTDDYVTSLDSSTRLALYDAIASGIGDDGTVAAFVTRGRAEGFVSASTASVRRFRDHIWARGARGVTSPDSRFESTADDGQRGVRP
jgi:hypothetical protein